MTASRSGTSGDAFHRPGRSIEPIAHLIARQYEKQPGSYMAFFSSFDYQSARRKHSRRCTRLFRTGRSVGDSASPSVWRSLIGSS
jgi:hypothetical protein